MTFYHFTTTLTPNYTFCIDFSAPNSLTDSARGSDCYIQLFPFVRYSGLVCVATSNQTYMARAIGHFVATLLKVRSGIFKR